MAYELYRIELQVRKWTTLSAYERKMGKKTYTID